MLMRAFYTAVWYALLPVVLVRLLWRSRRESGYRRHWAERFGFYRDQPARPVIWLHAVSVGETRAAQALVDALEQRYPEYQLLMTHMTPTGRRTSEQLFGDRVLRAYLPYDLPIAVRGFLQHFRPTLGVILETEIWPNLIEACRRAGVPLVLANARLSEKSFRGYRRIRALAGPAICGFSDILAQNERDAARFRAFGASAVAEMGNIKFDTEPDTALIAQGKRWRALFGGRPAVVLASTRDGEETLLLDGLTNTALDALIWIVPRHPQRFDAVAELLRARGFAFVRRSEIGASAAMPDDLRFVLGDSMGEMAAYYAASDVAFIGGSLLPYGGQNLIEACALGVPVVFGPHMYNFSEASRQALASGAAKQVVNADDAVISLSALVSNPTQRAAMAEAALAFSHAYRGATARLMARLDVRLTAARAPAFDQAPSRRRR